MPHISLTLYKGRKDDDLKNMAQVLQKSLEEYAGWKPSDISVSIKEEDPEGFVDYINHKTKSEKLVIPSDYIK